MSTQNTNSHLASTLAQDSATFSLTESDSYYIMAVDIPSIQSQGTEIITRKNQLCLETKTGPSSAKQTLFKLNSNGRGIKSVYKNGIMWLLLPKNNIATA